MDENDESAQNAQNKAGPVEPRSSRNKGNTNYGENAGQTNGLAFDRKGILSVLTLQPTTSEAALRSAAVYAPNGDLLGRINEVLIDTSVGNVAYVLVERGGVLGLDPTWFPVPVGR